MNSLGLKNRRLLQSIKAETALIVEDTNELQTNQGDWVTATGFNSVVPPTLAEMTAAFTEIKGAGWTTETLKDIRENAGGSTLTAQQVWEYATRELTSAATPAPTEAEMYAYFVSVGRADAFKADVSDKPTLAEMEDSKLARTAQLPPPPS